MMTTQRHGNALRLLCRACGAHQDLEQTDPVVATYESFHAEHGRCQEAASECPSDLEVIHHPRAPQD